MDFDLCRAATKVIVSTEKLVTADELSVHAENTIIPFFTVDAVVEVPLGSYPHECWGLYDADMKAIGDYASAVAKDGPAAAERYLQQWVFGPATFTDYLGQFGPERIQRQRNAVSELMRR